jgi:hypothetical protein
MKGSEDIESYLLRLGMPFEPVAASMWRLQVQDHESLIVSLAGPVVVFRLKVMELPAHNRERLYETLLHLNTTEMVHGAFGLEKDAVVVVAALALEDLDYSEFQTTVDDITLAVSKLYPVLSKFKEAA